MQKLTKRIPIGSNQVRHLVTLIGDSFTDPGMMRFQQHEMLRLLAATPELSSCGPLPFERLRMFFSGQAWVVEMEAIEELLGGGNGPTPDGTAQTPAR